MFIFLTHCLYACMVVVNINASQAQKAKFKYAREKCTGQWF